MKKNIFMIAAALILAASCAQEKMLQDEQQISATSETDVPMEEVSASFTLDNDFLAPDGTRTSINGSNQVTWESGDEIGAVFKFNSNYYVQTFKLKDDSEAGRTTAAFTGYMPTDFTGYVSFFYPKSAFTGGVKAYTSGLIAPIVLAPESQTYRDGNIAKGANLSMAVYKLNIPASSGSSTSLSMNFNLCNAGGILRINLTGSKKVRKIVLTCNDGFLCGTLAINPSSCTLQDAGTTSSVLTLDCGEEGVQLSDESTQFNLVIPSGRLSGGFTVKIYDTEGCFMRKTAQASEGNLVSRSTLLNMPAFEYDPLPAYVTSIVEPGFYSYPSGTLTQDFSFVSSGRQCIADADGCHVQNWAGSSSVGYTLPSSPVVGNSYDIAMTAETGTPESEHTSLQNVKYKGYNDNLAFFESSDGSRIYVFSVL